MKVFGPTAFTNNKSFIKRFNLLIKLSFKNQSNKFVNNKISVEDETSEEFSILKFDLNSSNSLDIFEEIKRKENLDVLKMKNDDKYQKISNLRAYQTANNKLIIDAINRNRDIKRIISDKTDCSDDNLIGFNEAIWDNEIEKANVGSDLDELDDNKIEELIEYVQNTSIDDLEKFKITEINDMSDIEYKKYIIDILKYLQLTIDKKFVKKSSKETKNDQVNSENINDIEKKLNNGKRSIDKYFLEKQTLRRIIFGQKGKEYNSEKLEGMVEYLNEESNIDFKSVNPDDPEIVGQYIPQTHKERKKFKQIIDIKSENILV